MALTPGPPGVGAGRALERLLAHLDGSDPERAGTEYAALHRALRRFFEWRGALAPEDCADVALDRLAAKLDEGVRVVDVRALAHGIAAMVLLEERRARSRRAPLDGAADAALAAAGGREPWEDGDAGGDGLLDRLEHCLAALPDDGRAVVLEYYAHPGGSLKIAGRRRLARRLRLSDNALRSRVQRLRDRLEDCVRRLATGAES